MATFELKISSTEACTHYRERGLCYSEAAHAKRCCNRARTRPRRSHLQFHVVICDCSSHGRSTLAVRRCCGPIVSTNISKCTCTYHAMLCRASLADVPLRPLREPLTKDPARRLSEIIHKLPHAKGIPLRDVLDCPAAHRHAQDPNHSNGTPDLRHEVPNCRPHCELSRKHQAGRNNISYDEQRNRLQSEDLHCPLQHKVEATRELGLERGLEQEWLRATGLPCPRTPLLPPSGLRASPAPAPRALGLPRPRQRALPALGGMLPPPPVLGGVGGPGWHPVYFKGTRGTLRARGCLFRTPGLFILLVQPELDEAPLAGANVA